MDGRKAKVLSGVLSEGGVRTGTMEDSGEPGYLLDWVLCTSLAVQAPRAAPKKVPSLTCLQGQGLPQDPFPEPPQMTTPLMAERGLRVPSSPALPELGELSVGSQGK